MQLVPWIVLILTASTLPPTYTAHTLVRYGPLPRRAPAVKLPILLHRLKNTFQVRPKLRIQRQMPKHPQRNKKVHVRQQFKRVKSFKHPHKELKTKAPTNIAKRFPTNHVIKSKQPRIKSAKTISKPRPKLNAPLNNIITSKLNLHAINNSETTQLPLLSSTSPKQTTKKPYSNNTYKKPVLTGSFTSINKPVNQHYPTFRSLPSSSTRSVFSNPSNILPTYPPEVYVKDKVPEKPNSYTPELKVLIPSYKIVNKKPLKAGPNVIYGKPSTIFNKPTEVQKNSKPSNGNSTSKPEKSQKYQPTVNNENYETAANNNERKSPEIYIKKQDLHFGFKPVQLHQSKQKIKSKLIKPVIKTVPSSTVASYYNTKTKSNPTATTPRTKHNVYNKHKRPQIREYQPIQSFPKTLQPIDLFKNSHLNGMFEDDFGFPFDRITPSNIIKNIAVLSKDSAKDSIGTISNFSFFKPGLFKTDKKIKERVDKVSRSETNHKDESVSLDKLQRRSQTHWSSSNWEHQQHPINQRSFPQHQVFNEWRSLGNIF